MAYSDVLKLCDYRILLDLNPVALKAVYCTLDDFKRFHLSKTANILNSSEKCNKVSFYQFYCRAGGPAHRDRGCKEA